MEDGTGLEILDERRQEVMDLLTAMLQLGRLPDRIQVTVCDLSLHCQEIQNDVRLFDNLNKREYTLTVALNQTIVLTST